MQNDPGWDKLVDAIDVKFGIQDHGKETSPLPDNPEFTQTVRFITFTKDGSDYKLTRTTRPSINDRKSHYHKAQGSGVRFENIYDPEALTHSNQLWKKSAGDWEPVQDDEGL